MGEQIEPRTKTTNADADRCQTKPVISPAEDERRKHVKAAIADSRIEGYPPPSRPEQAILDAYIRGEIDARDLVKVHNARVRTELGLGWRTGDE